MLYVQKVVGLRRTEVLLIVFIAIGALLATLTFYAIHEVGTLSRAPPDDFIQTGDPIVSRDPTADTVPRTVEDEDGTAHVFWMRDGWYYKKFDRFGNELTTPINTSHREDTSYLSEEAWDIDAEQDIHFIWVPGGYSGDGTVVRYDAEGNVVITWSDQVEEDEHPGEEPVERHSFEDNPLIRRWLI
jgi:hypothetical protein